MRNLLILFTFVFSQACIAQFSPIENIGVGVYGRGEQNIYNYFEGRGLGDYYTQRVTPGYSAGVYIHSSVNYLFNASLSFGIGECKYAQQLKKGNTQLYSSQFRLVFITPAAELKLGNNERRRPVFQLGGQIMMVNKKTEIFSNYAEPDLQWPRTRFMPFIGIGYQIHLKRKWMIQPAVQLRIAMNNKVGYDYPLNQVAFALHISRKIKSW